MNGISQDIKLNLLFRKKRMFIRAVNCVTSLSHWGLSRGLNLNTVFSKEKINKKKVNNDLQLH